MSNVKTAICCLFPSCTQHQGIAKHQTTTCPELFPPFSKSQQILTANLVNGQTPPTPLVYQHIKYQIQIIFSSITTNYQPHNTRLTPQTSSAQRSPQRISNPGLFALIVCTLCKSTCLHLGQHCQLPQIYKMQWLAYFLSSLSAHQVSFYEVDHCQLSSN